MRSFAPVTSGGHRWDYCWSVPDRIFPSVGPPLTDTIFRRAKTACLRFPRRLATTAAEQRGPPDGTDLQGQPSPGGAISRVSLHARGAGHPPLEQQAGELVQGLVHLLHEGAGSVDGEGWVMLCIRGI